MPKVSIIVPIYKCQEYIETCIESIVQQEYRDFELLLIIDGDFDDCGKICRRYENIDPRIRVIEKENEGVSVARNVGIDMAHGKWIVFVDSDDWLEKNYLSTMVKLAEDEKADICICSYIVEYASYSQPGSFFQYSEHKFTDIDKDKLLISCIVNTDISGKQAVTNVGVPWAKIYNASFIKMNNIRFVPGLKRMQDMIFNLYAFYKSSTICYRDIPLYHYSKNSQSSTLGYRADYSDTIIMIDKEIERFIKYAEYTKLEEVRYCKSISLINEMIQLQFVHSENKDLIHIKLKKIRKIVLETSFNENLKRCKGKYLSQSQKIELFMLKNKCFVLIYLYKKLKFLKEKIQYLK